jgi:hypothetical protein
VLPAFAGFLSQPGVIARTGELFAGGHGPPGIPHLVADYLHAEQRLGRIRPDADVEAVGALIVGACHEFVLPRMLFNPDAPPVTVPQQLIDNLAATIMDGIAPPAKPRKAAAKSPAARRR